MFQEAPIRKMESRQTSTAPSLLLDHLWVRRSLFPHILKKRCPFLKIPTRYKSAHTFSWKWFLFWYWWCWEVERCIDDGKNAAVLPLRCSVSVSSGPSQDQGFWWASLTWIQGTSNLTSSLELKLVSRWSVSTKIWCVVALQHSLFSVKFTVLYLRPFASPTFKEVTQQLA